MKQRKLVQWALAYVAGAWALLQVADLLSDAYAWPALVMRVLPVVLATGFFAALILAWYHGERGRQKVSTIEIGILTGILLLGGAAVGLLSRDAADGGAAPGPSSVSAMSAPASAMSAAAEQGSIAVLPFENMSADEDNEAFSDGISEELLNVLAQLPELRVAARTSAFAFKNKDVGIDSIARALNVRHVLEGSVRKAGKRVRITAQLIDAATGYHLWSETYDRQLEDIFAVQDEISRAIVDQLEIRLTRPDEPLAKVQTTDPEAHALVLRGRQLALRGGDPATQLAAAERLFEEAIARDRGYAAAWAGLANVHRLQLQFGLRPRGEGFERARAEAEHALQLDPSEGDAHVVLGTIAWLLGDLETAGTHLERGLRANPADARTMALYGQWLLGKGRVDEARRMARRAVELDPLAVAAIHSAGLAASQTGDLHEAERMYERALIVSPDHTAVLGDLAFTRVLLGERDEALRLARRVLRIAPRSADDVARAGWVHAYARDFERAIELFRRSIELAPDSPGAVTRLANALMMVGREQEAVENVERALESDASGSYDRVIGAYVYARSGRREDAERLLRTLPEDELIGRAAVYANLGDRDRAFRLLEQAVERRAPGVAEIGADWWFDPLRGDPRMDRLMERLGVPEVAAY